MEIAFNVCGGVLGHSNTETINLKFEPFEKIEWRAGIVVEEE